MYEKGLSVKRHYNGKLFSDGNFLPEFRLFGAALAGSAWGICFGVVLIWFCVVGWVCYSQMSVFCLSLGVSLYLVCGEGVWGEVVFCNALVVFVVPHPYRFAHAGFASPSAAAVVCQVCLAWLGALLGFPWCPKPATTQMTFSLVA